jgi:hypothetical protein
VFVIGKSREIHGKIPIQSEPSICGTGGNHLEPIRNSGFGIRDFPVQGITEGEIAIPRFPIEWRREVTWREKSARAIGVSGFGVRGFRHPGKLVSWIRDPRNPEGDVAAWTPDVSGRQVAPYRESVYRYSEVCGRSEP